MKNPSVLNFKIVSFLISGGTVVKYLPAVQEMWVQSLGREDPLEKGMAAHPCVLAWKSHGQSSLVGCGPWGLKESDMTLQLNSNKHH